MAPVKGAGMTGMQLHLAKKPSGRAAKHYVKALAGLDADLRTIVMLAEVPTGSVAPVRVQCSDCRSHDKFVDKSAISINKFGCHLR